ncbi:hypothetical protein NN3_61500 [Nocardia neocaledoniensis NBRC 108232]|uniref:Uncharacterized protein n=1 Tax=Nocardia neocaledoniensis TaxID=236511 RepID=A0A317NVK5_9NOCA|nr:hypothetical protein [Nocardia neocaledoniensis]PWV77848.1 hypothetical protein DFR69_103448 [Nocardia neocaledoniensis]GEM35143.1 hypothetical protein NN3_61500 [Nocardia neocaledoniensis NBRC 108232]
MTSTITPRNPVGIDAKAITWAVLGVQMMVMLAVTALRFAAGGWLLVIFLFGGFLVVFAPSVLAVAVALPVMRRGGSRVRVACAGALAAGYAALLTAAATMPDFTDAADENGVPIVAIVSGSGTLTNAQAQVYHTISGVAVLCYLAATVATIVLAITLLVIKRSAGRAR